jgi:hypothetical protein
VPFTDLTNGTFLPKLLNMENVFRFCKLVKSFVGSFILLNKSATLTQSFNYAMLECTCSYLTDYADLMVFIHYSVRFYHPIKKGNTTYIAELTQFSELESNVEKINFTAHYVLFYV